MNIGQLIGILSNLDPSIRFVAYDEMNEASSQVSFDFGWFIPEPVGRGGEFIPDDSDKAETMPPEAEEAVCLFPWGTDMNVELTESDVAALNERFSSGNFPVRKVKRNAG